MGPVIVGCAEGAVGELLGGLVDGGEAAEVELNAEDVNTARRVLGVVGWPGARSEGFGGFGELGRVAAEAQDGFSRLLCASCRGDNDDVGGERSGQEVFVDDALTDAETDATAEGRMSADGTVLGVKVVDVPVGAGDEDEKGLVAGDRVPRRWSHCSGGNQ